MDQLSISDRLRYLKEQQGWTAQQMADAIGMSRRTLESYMRREKPPLPGLEVLSQIARGLGVSLDWLIIGGEAAKLREVLVARVCAERAALPVLQNVIQTLKDGKQAPEAGFLAREIGAQAAQKADLFLDRSITSGQLLGLMEKFETDISDELRQKIAALRVELARLEKERDAKEREPG